VLKQKEKGGDHIDFRKKEEQRLEGLKQQENNLERKLRREAREKRKQEGRKALGLDIFN